MGWYCWCVECEPLSPHFHDFRTGWAARTARCYVYLDHSNDNMRWYGNHHMYRIDLFSLNFFVAVCFYCWETRLYVYSYTSLGTQS